VNIRVGATPPVGSPGDNVATPAGQIEARVLGVRDPRRRQGERPPKGTERRNESRAPDPAGGRVLILLIPEGHRVPEGLDSGAYRVFLRFAKR
jgi:hypothetical protein